ncbi:hypothetical protein JW826_02405 [Candidatus Woesearchaeota archaeon]|nr:hypothetical protein [Candidatus Woesearchaeota archaeon]
MGLKTPTNIREFVWKAIDTDPSIRKSLSRGILNNRALALHIIREHALKVSLDSVISAIRRYQLTPKKSASRKDAYILLRQAKIKTITKMASLTLKKNEDTTRKLAQALPEVNYEGGETLRILEGAKIFKLLVDENSFEKMNTLFGRANVLETRKKIGMIELTYSSELQNTPGVFSVVSSELGENEISIIDALVCSNEHIIVVDEKSLLKTFNLLYELCA